MIVPATLEHAERLAPSMRVADRDECWASARLLPMQALALSIEGSSHAWTWEHRGEVLSVGGVGPGPGGVLGRVGIVWMLGSTRIRHHPAPFLRMSAVAISKALAAYPLLVNYTDARHTASHRWLRWLGATLGEPEPHGAFGLPFIPFRIGAKSCAG